MWQGYTNYQLDPSKGTYSQVGGNAPPFMGVDPSGKPYTSFARAPGPAPGPASTRVAASAAAAAQQVRAEPLSNAESCFL